MMAPGQEKAAQASGGPRQRYFIEGDRPLWNSLHAGCGANQDQVKAMMGRALQRWLDSHGLLAIAGAVLGIALLLSILMVGGGYLWVTP
jgi:hypothetical protein